MKIAPLIRAIRRRSNLGFRLVHTGQHYDHDMSQVFFDELDIPAPDTNLNCGGGSHAEQTARIMVAFEKELLEHRPDWVVVVGDVNSTLACAITAKKLNIQLAHVEAGLRSGDRNMPEEINRLATDAIADQLFATEPSAVDNLLREGHSREKVHFVGHVMVDNLFHQLQKLTPELCAGLSSEPLKKSLGSRYGVVTLHRPSNIDDTNVLGPILSALSEISETLPLVFPVHPRTKEQLERTQNALPRKILLTAPLSYMNFLNLWRDASIVLTDSGGLQEETTALGIPCVTIRNSTERPITIEAGSNSIAGVNGPEIIKAAQAALKQGSQSRRPPLWDGNAAERICSLLTSQAAPS